MLARVFTSSTLRLGNSFGRGAAHRRQNQGRSHNEGEQESLRGNQNNSAGLLSLVTQDRATDASSSGSCYRHETKSLPRVVMDLLFQIRTDRWQRTNVTIQVLFSSQTDQIKSDELDTCFCGQYKLKALSDQKLFRNPKSLWTEFQKFNS